MIQIQPQSLKPSWLCVVNQSVHQLEIEAQAGIMGWSPPSGPGWWELRLPRQQSEAEGKCRLQLLALWCVLPTGGTLI